MNAKFKLPARRSLVPILIGLVAISLTTLIPSTSAESAAPAEKSIDAPNGLKIHVKMIGPVTQTTDLQVICVLKHNPAPGGDIYKEAMADLNDKLGGIISSLRERGEFAGEAGETLLFTPPANTIAAKRVLLIGVGEESTLTLATLRLAGRIIARESIRLGVAHVSFAPTLRDQGSTRIDVGDGDAAVSEQLILACDTERRLQDQGLTPKANLVDFTIEAGSKYFDSASQKVTNAVASAAAQIATRNPRRYSAATMK
jgi:cytosol aminopeptidase family protein